MAGDPRWAHASARNRDRRYWRSMGLPCAICGQPIDYTLEHYYVDENGQRRVNQDAFVIDEIIPVARGGDPYDRDNQQPAHVRCNLAKADKLPGETRAVRAGQLVCLYDWTS